MTWIKIATALVVFCLALLGGFLALLHFAYLEFEHRDDHNGVGWAKFARNVEKEIHRSGFKSDDFGHYEGKVMTGTLRSGDKSIQLPLLQRGSYLDARDMNTLKEVRIKKINDKAINCYDEEGHLHYAAVLSQSIPTELGDSNYTSISEILSGHKNIAKVVSSFPESEFTVVSGEVKDVPSWLSINPLNSSCHKPTHDIHKLSCRVE